MTVNLKQIPPPEPQPAPPNYFRWLLLLLLALAVSTLYALDNHTISADVDVKTFMETCGTIPLLGWLLLLLFRLCYFSGQQGLAEKSRQRYEQLVRQETRRGQRAMQVLGISLHSALRNPEDSDGQKQWQALQDKVQAIKTQPGWHSEEGIRHSRLIPLQDETPEQLLSRMLKQTLKELSRLLVAVPEDMPLAVLMEQSCNLPENQLQTLWQSAWAASRIRQPVKEATGQGFAAVDNWLDQHVNDRALLLVVAFQIDAAQPEGSAEAIAGLLLATPYAAAGLPPLATLHRPEQAHQIGDADLRYAFAQSFEWVPVDAGRVSSGWLTGVAPCWHQTIAAELAALSSPINPGQHLHNLDATLGYPGAAAPWLAVACATKGAQRGEPQLIVSGDATDDTPLWSTLVTPL